MKHLLITLIALLFITKASAEEFKSSQILGKWYNPYTVENLGEYRGFHFKRNGKCEALGIKSLELDSWRIEKGRLIIEGIEITEDGKRIPYKTSERIDTLSKTKLSLVAAEKPFRMVFVYMPKTEIKKRLQSKGDKQE
ncbi:MAG: lipocalin family protein [Marinifilaceae bacterium]